MNIYNKDKTSHEYFDEWKDWCTSTYNDTIESIESLDVNIINEYINKIDRNIKNDISPYSEEYLNECLSYIDSILKGNYEYIDLLENIGAYFPYKEAFIECLKRLSETEV